jgi:hypothetical protein
VLAHWQTRWSGSGSVPTKNMKSCSRDANSLRERQEAARPKPCRIDVRFWPRVN